MVGRAGARLAVLGVLLAGAVPALAAARSFDSPGSPDTSQQFGAGSVQRQDTPNDPSYDNAESDDEDVGVSPSTNLYDERFDLFGFPSARTQLTARYVEGPHAGQPMVSGFNAAGAWKLTRGRPSVSVAILDTGIKWNKVSLRTKVRLNAGELPTPQHDRATASSDTAVCATDANADDANGDGAYDVLDYVCDSRVKPDAGKNGDPKLLDAQDLIATFSDGKDTDGNHYVDDIAGWDFFDDDNDAYDASSYFAASNHGSGRAEEAGARTDDKDGEPAVCPKCQIVPLRVWDTFVSDQNNFALAILYATDNGVSVIEGADGGLYHSAFAEHASQYAYEHGVTQAYSGDDLNTGNHNYPANYNHTMLIQGTVPDTIGLGMNFSNQASQFLQGLGLTLQTGPPVKTYFRGAGTTQYGGHSSLSMEGSTGSENTGKAAGAAGMVISAALGQGIALRADETREILEQSAEDITGGASGVDGNVAGTGAPDHAQPGWDLHFGWGRANLGAAVSLAASGKIPPEASIGSPDWFAPLTGSRVSVTGRARARFATGGRFHWKLEWGPGLAPTTWTTAAQGDSSSEVTDFGSLDLEQIHTAVANYTPPVDPGLPTFAAPNPFSQQFAVQLVVTGEGLPTAGIDRKVFLQLDDPTLLSGYPKRLPAGGEAPLQYADLNADNAQELIVPVEDGTVHAYEPDNSELPGFPVRTRVQSQAVAHTAAPGVAAIGAPLEPPRSVAVADLDDDGRPELITTAGVHIYVWEPDGKLRPGFPVSINRAFCRPEDESQPLHHRKCGFLASPAVGRLEGASKPLDIVVPALDGHLYAVRGNGTALPGFPVDLADPGVAADKRVLAESINNPAIGDINGDGRDDVVAASNEVYDANPPSGDDVAGLFAQGFADLLANAAGGSTRVYAVNGATGKFLPGWPIKVNGGIQDVLPLVGPGHDPSIALIGGRKQIVVSATGGALSEYSAAGGLTRAMQQSSFGPASNATDHSGALNLFESAAIGDVLGLGQPAVVKYNTTLAGGANLLLSGQNFPWQHLIGAFDATNGASLPAFPRVTDDYQFLSSSTIAKVDPASKANQVLAGTGLGLLHAYDGATGRDAPGFPKPTGGWLFAPATLSQSHRMAGITREGFLFQWSSPAEPCQTEWPDFRHDPQHTGNYNRDGTAPGKPYGAHRVPTAAGSQLRFRAPGDDLLCGLAKRYEIAESSTPITPANFARVRHVNASFIPKPGVPRSQETVALPASAPPFLAVRAIDEAGNVGPLTAVGRQACRDRFAPRTTVYRSSLRLRHGGRHRGVSIAGRSQDRFCSSARRSRNRGLVRRVDVAVGRIVAHGCRFLDRRGHFGRRRSCRRPVFVTARIRSDRRHHYTRWTLSRRVSLPRGLYDVTARAADFRGNLEGKRRLPRFIQRRAR